MRSPFALFGKLKQAVTAAARSDQRFADLTAHVDRRLDDLRFNQGLMLAALNERRESRSLQDFEFTVFSQWGEDGILQFLTRVVPIKHRTFLEFGVEDFMESNCRFLLMKDHWQGFVIDGSPDHIARLKASHFYWKHQLTAVDAFVTKDNVNALLARSGFDEDVGILSIDIDGVDYFVLEAITAFRPRILICEYNAAFGPTRRISVPYDANFQRTKAHASNLYWGASLAAMTHLAASRGYALVGTNSAGNNAFFVRDDLLGDRLDVVTPEQAHAWSTFREGRDAQGNFTFLSGEAQLAVIRGMPVVQVETGVVEPF